MNYAPSKAVQAAADAVHACQCKVRPAYDTAWTAANANNDANAAVSQGRSAWNVSLLALQHPNVRLGMYPSLLQSHWPMVCQHQFDQHECIHLQGPSTRGQGGSGSSWPVRFRLFMARAVQAPHGQGGSGSSSLSVSLPCCTTAAKPV